MADPNIRLDDDHSDPSTDGGDRNTQVDDSQSAELSDPGRRFLGGQQSWRDSQPVLAWWVRAFFLAIASVISILLLITVLGWKFQPSYADRSVHCLVAQQAPTWRSLGESFARADAARVLGITNSELTNSNLTIPNSQDDIRAFVRLRLTQDPEATGVIYLRTSATFDWDGWSLLPDNSEPLSSGTGFPIKELFENLADSSHENVLLILDVLPVDSLRSGSLARPFISELQSLFRMWQKDRGHQGPNVTLICAAGDGELRSISPRFQVSPFAASVAYCLQGGAEADTGSEGSNVPDGHVSAFELGEFVTNRVGTWSLQHRGVIQRPIVITAGDDFLISAVDSEVEFLRVFTGASESDEETASANPPPASVASDSPPSDVDVEPTELDSFRDNPAFADLDDLQLDVFEELRDCWDLIHHAIENRSLRRSPATIALAVHELMIAETMLLGGDAPGAKQRLTRNFTQLKSQLNAAAIPELSEGQLSDALQRALKTPTDTALQRLALEDSAGSRLLVRLAGRCRLGDQWRHPDTVSELLELTLQTTEVLRLAELTDLDVYRRGFEETADHLVRAESALHAGQYRESQQRLKILSERLTKLNDSLQETQNAVGTVERMTFYMPFFVKTLGRLDKTTSRPGISADTLNGIMTSLVAVLRTDASRPLDRLYAISDLASSTLSAATKGAQSSLVERHWNDMVSFLALPAIPTQLRLEILATILAGEDDTQFSATGSSIPSPSNPHLATDSLEQRLFVFHDELVDVVGTIDTNPLLIVPPDSSQTPASDDIPNQDDRGSFPVSSSYANQSEVRGWIRKLHSESMDLELGESPSQSALIGARLLNIVNSYWAGISLESLDFQNQSASILWKKFQDSVEHTGQRLRQIQTARLPASSLQSMTEMTVFGSKDTALQILEGAQLLIPPGEEVIQELVIRSLSGSMKQGPEANAELIWEWDDELYPVEFDISLVQEASRQNPALNATGSQLRFQIKASCLTPPSGTQPFAGPVPVGVRLKLSESESIWLPVTVSALSTTQVAAKLKVDWDDAGLPNGRIDLLPNQSIPVSISVDLNTPLPKPLRVDFLTAGVVKSISLPADAHLTAGQYAVTVPEEFDIEFTGERIRLQLYSGNELIDETDLGAAVLELAQCFRVDSSIDPIRRQVVTRVNRVHQGDVHDAVEFRATVPTTSAGGGRQAGTLSPEATQLKLSSQLGERYVSSVSLNASDVPRAFRLLFDRKQLNGIEDESISLEIRNPTQLSKYEFRSGRREMPISIAADGPGDLTVSAGFDVNGSGTLQPDEQQFQSTYPGGRQSKLQLRSPAESESMSVESVVEDITIPLDVTGIEGAIPIVVSVSNGRQRVQKSLLLFILRESPPVTILEPKDGDPQSSNVPITLTLGVPGTLAQAIDDLEIGFDLDLDGQLAAEEVVTPVGVAPGAQIQFGRRDRAILRIPTPSPFAPQVSLLVRSKTDLSIDPAAEPELPDPAAPASETAEPVEPQLVSEWSSRAITFVSTGEIKGTVRRADGSPAAGAILTLSNGVRVAADARGSFSFPATLAGVYRLTAQSGNRAAAGVVAVKAAQVSSIDLTIYVR